MAKTALVCGAGGFIGGHLVRRLKQEGFWVRAQYDADYAAKCAAALDWKVLLRTAIVPFNMSGR